MKWYFPEEMAIKLAEMVKADVFVETGTFLGNTTKWAASKFKEVHTSELSEELFRNAEKGLLSIGNITPHLGDSKKVLPKILEAAHGNIVFWLDAHYSTGITAGGETACPLLTELSMILKRSNGDIILIDDARCVDGTDGWPTIGELYETIIKYSATPRFMLICDDHIYIIPDEDKLKKVLFEYSLQRNVELWEQIKQKGLKRLGLSFLRAIGIYDVTRKIYRRFKRNKFKEKLD
jgi:hypothetical protein